MSSIGVSYFVGNEEEITEVHDRQERVGWQVAGGGLQVSGRRSRTASDRR